MANDEVALKRAPTQRYIDRKNSILDAAIELLNTRGIAGMTLGEVAARLDLVSTAVMYYYKNKEVLASACFDSGIARYMAVLEGTCSETGIARLELLTRNLFELNRQISVGEARILPSFNEARSLDDPDINSKWINLFKSFREVIEDAANVELGAIDKNVRTHQLVTQTLWANHWLMEREPETFSRLADRFFNIFSEGLVSDRLNWKPPESLDTGFGLQVDDGSRENLLRAATILMNAKGYKGASVDLIAAHLDMTKGAFYHHFETKDELVKDCFARTFELIKQAQRFGESEGATGADKLLIAMAVLIQHQFSEDVPLLRISAAASMTIEERTQIFHQFDRLTMRFSGMIADGIIDGSIRPIDPYVGALMVSGTLTSAVEARFWASDLNAKNAASAFLRPVALGIVN